MNIRAILLLGGTGFIGSHLADRLTAQGYRLVVPTRRRERGKHLALLPTVDLVQANIHDPAVLTELMRGVDAVINLVGVLHSKSGRPYGADFAKVHVDLPQKIVSACNAMGIQRLLHVSALGASAQAPSEYLRSKADGEVAIRRAAAPWTIFRPSVVFGQGDRFINLFAELARKFPVLPLAGANARFQPVFVGDVVEAIVRSLTLDASFEQAYELAGPKIYSLQDLVRYVAELTGHRRPIVPLSDRLGMLQAAMLECLPGALMSRDNVRSMQVDSIASAEPLPFGMQATTLEAVAPGYLGRHTSRPNFDLWRRSAGRV
jgi:uncharacterized protein YbjT (DUF2867 family)